MTCNCWKKKLASIIKKIKQIHTFSRVQLPLVESQHCLAPFFLDIQISNLIRPRLPIGPIPIELGGRGSWGMVEGTPPPPRPMRNDTILNLSKQLPWIQFRLIINESLDFKYWKLWMVFYCINFFFSLWGSVLKFWLSFHQFISKNYNNFFFL